MCFWGRSAFTNLKDLLVSYWAELFKYLAVGGDGRRDPHRCIAEAALYVVGLEV